MLVVCAPRSAIPDPNFGGRLVPDVNDAWSDLMLTGPEVTHSALALKLASPALVAFVDKHSEIPAKIQLRKY